MRLIFYQTASKGIRLGDLRYAVNRMSDWMDQYRMRLTAKMSYSRFIFLN